MSALPTLDQIGGSASIHCWRLRRESDRAYAHRLSLHIQTLIIESEDRRRDLEALLTGVLAYKVNPQLTEQPNE